MKSLFLLTPFHQPLAEVVPTKTQMSRREFALVVDQPTRYWANIWGQLFYRNSLLVYLHLLEFIDNVRFGFCTDEDAWQQHAFALGLALLRTNGCCNAQKTLQHELDGVCKTTVWRSKAGNRLHRSLFSWVRNQQSPHQKSQWWKSTIRLQRLCDWWRLKKNYTRNE